MLPNVLWGNVCSAENCLAKHSEDNNLKTEDVTTTVAIAKIYEDNSTQNDFKLMKVDSIILYTVFISAILLNLFDCVYSISFMCIVLFSVMFMDVFLCQTIDNIIVNYRFSECDIFEKAVQISVMVHTDSTKSINDSRSRYAKFAYFNCVKRRCLFCKTRSWNQAEFL